MSRADANDAFGVYIHWPFCLSKCPYCDFNSHVRHAPIDEARYVNAFAREIEAMAARAPGREVSSIFFGGGTPSLMPPATVAALIAAAERHWGFADGIEITLEANPSSVEAARFADLAAAGVNRVSLGLQALDDAVLAFLGRAHGVDEGLRALETAQAAFDRVSFDLVYARPEQSAVAWETELARAIGFGTGHLSLYQLTIEPGTRFATLVANGALRPVDPDHGATLFELTRAMTAAAGLAAYEVSNHARPGEASRHNLSYWRYDDYLGVGPGAHGRRLAQASERHRKPENFLSAVARNGHGIVREDALSPAARASEALLMGLRLSEGVDLAHIARRTGCDRLVDRAAVERLAGHELVTLTGDRLTVSDAGMLLLDSILAEIVVAGV